MKRTNRLLLIALLVLTIVGIPAVVFLSQQRQETRSRASASTTLYFTPSSTTSAPVQKTVGQPVSFDIMVNPGNNRPTVIKLDISYDVTKLDATTSSFVANAPIFYIQEGPVLQNGRVLVTVTIGNDPSKAISQITKVGTINLTARAISAPNTTSLSFGPDSQVLSSATGDQSSENVLSVRTPAYISISGVTTVTPTRTPTPIPPTPTRTPTPTPPPGASTLTCSTTTIVLSDLMRTISVTLKNSSGVEVSGKTVNWSSANTNVSITPSSSVTNSSGVATVNAGVTQASAPSFTSSIVARVSDGSVSPPTCTTPVSYTTRITPTPTRTPTPTPTSVPNATKLTFNVFMHGIGNSGDNSNPNFSLSNKNPLTKTRTVDVQILNGANVVKASGSGTITYASASGSFKGVIDLGLRVPATASYNIKLKERTHLRRLVPGFSTITIGQNHVIPAIALVAGDITGPNGVQDNLLNILDYNILIGCYSDFSQPKSCTTANKPLADLNDDGKVNGSDYNLFMREVIVQSGE